DLGLALERGVLLLEHRAPAQHVDRAVLRRRHEPRARLVGHALARPLLRRGDSIRNTASIARRVSSSAAVTAADQTTSGAATASRARAPIILASATAGA